MSSDSPRVADVEALGDETFSEEFRKDAWRPAMLSAAFLAAGIVSWITADSWAQAITYSLGSFVLVPAVWLVRFAYAEVRATEAKYLAAMALLLHGDAENDEPEA